MKFLTSIRSDHVWFLMGWQWAKRDIFGNQDVIDTIILGGYVNHGQGNYLCLLL